MRKTDLNPLEHDKHLYDLKHTKVTQQVFSTPENVEGHVDFKAYEKKMDDNVSDSHIIADQFKVNHDIFLKKDDHKDVHHKGEHHEHHKHHGDQYLNRK
jgi:hypothetical protein